MTYICNKCGLIGTSDKKKTQEAHDKIIKGHKADLVTEDIYFGKK